MVTGAMVADGCRIESTNDYQVVYEKDVAAGVAVTPDAVCGQLTGPVYWVTAIFVADSLGVTVTASRDLIRNPRTECMARIPASTADLQVVLERLESEMERSSSR
jgi:hypothetical protein